MGHISKGQSDKTPVRAELIKQLTLIGVIVVIAVWQRHFVIQAASADVYIFALLFGTAIFGFYNTIRGTYALKNEFIALRALKEVHDDARREPAEPADHARIVCARFEDAAIVYDAPKALGTAHNLIYAELLRNGTISIPPATMQVLVSDLETKLDERQSMGHYLGALMVLLGLLGTFIGLMHTLESVGGILGSLDLSGNGGTGAIAELIESLKKPLEGMSTGFGASLFGLIGSLVIGVLSKFDSKVAHHLQHDFETWLRSTVQIETARQRTGEISQSGEVDPSLSNNWRTVLQVARNTVLATSKLSACQAQLGDGLDLFSKQFAERDHKWVQHFERIARRLEDQTLIQEETRATLERLRADIGEMSDAVCSTNVNSHRIFEGHLVDNRILMERNYLRVERLDEVIAQLSERFLETNAYLQSINKQLSKANEKGCNTADRNDALVADLEHLIAAMRLRTEDVISFRKLTSMLRSHSETESIHGTAKGVAL